MIICNCCAHCWTQCTKSISHPRAHNRIKIEIKHRAASIDGINGKALKRGWWECRCIPPRGWLEQMAKADMGKDVFLRLTQVSGTAQARVLCQLRCMEDRCLSARSSLTPRSVSSGPQAVVILILLARPEIKKGTLKARIRKTLGMNGDSELQIHTAHIMAGNTLPYKQALCRHTNMYANCACCLWLSPNWGF